ncbi:ROK family transcriptional regulator [Cytobacillus solani]|uniref:ROK family transcriptional regulator n=1 Tax=Cytobacillus solani TaxID=1637975 RepID=A0A0Q3TE39_9BACI|nr:ROK family transcriptional regulator [Cytobacillus solani]KOP71950.1 ROK family transcriptional regulator [Bacillus sp. FJAT-21945]KQL21389.1 ROK family transcriptional regulator [Cytobacillus solani]USK54684.1 ROK family transcriptional regulator [Cytobacillus solani]
MSSKRNSTPLKTTNKKVVLQCIKENQPISRAEIASKLQISKPTVSLLVDELVQENWVLEKGIGMASSQGGRRPIQLCFNEKAGYVIGTDIGGTKVKTVICDLIGNIICSSSFKTNHYLQTGLLKQIHKEINCMIQTYQLDSSKMLGMGVGIPGITEPTNGVVVEAPSINWVRYPFITEAKRYFSFPIFVDNDVNVAALGEQWLGNGRSKDNILFIAVGTGIGSGIIIHNQLYRGSSCAAGEMGYMVTDKNDMRNEFKPIFHRYGYLESVAGGKAIGERLTKLIRQKQDHPMFEEASKSELTGEIAFTLAKEGDEAARLVVDDAIEHLAYGIINAASLLNPEVIILGGGVFKSSDYILPRLREIVYQYLPSSVELNTSQLGENAEVLGAVSLFLREFESVLN